MSLLFNSKIYLKEFAGQTDQLFLLNYINYSDFKNRIRQILYSKSRLVDYHKI